MAKQITSLIDLKMKLLMLIAFMYLSPCFSTNIKSVSHPATQKKVVHHVMPDMVFADISLTGDRVFNKVQIECIDSLNIYIQCMSTPESYILLKIPKSQIVSSNLSLYSGGKTLSITTYPRSLKKFYKGYKDYDGQEVSVIQLEPTNMYIFGLFVRNVDNDMSFVDCTMHNLSKNRLKYADLSVQYFDWVDDPIERDYVSEQVNPTERIKGFRGYIEPGLDVENGGWLEMTRDAAHVELNSVTITDADNEETSFDRGDPELLIIENLSAEFSKQWKDVTK